MAKKTKSDMITRSSEYEQRCEMEAILDGPQQSTSPQIYVQRSLFRPTTHIRLQVQYTHSSEAFQGLLLSIHYTAQLTRRVSA